tara:strand:+ start:392 stop:1078 length:687 start_codon:yes stop_codon:yes gene_type:complete
LKKIAISQSNYIPWKGYFDLIASVDEFIIYDDMQYTRRDWRNRNKIKTNNGTQWLTVPVRVKGKYFQSINETEINGDDWKKQHWGSIKSNYSKAKFFKEISEELEKIYFEFNYKYLSDLNFKFLKYVCDYLEINTILRKSSEFKLLEGKTEKLIGICEQSGGTVYISGPAAKAYIDLELFNKKEISLEWFDYDNYPVYDQLHGDFIHEVTVLDLIFNCGQNSRKFMKF